MAAQAQSLDGAPITGPVTAGEPQIEGSIRYVARQPILDLRGRVHGYELLFRNGPEEMFRGDGQAATRTVIDNTVLFGLSKLTSGLPAFVNCTEEALTSDVVHMLPASMTVLEILETIEPSPTVFRACCKLKSAGYRLALDDFVWRHGLEPLIELADYIKVDFLLTDRTERRSLLNRLGGVTVALVAEKVETEEQYREAREDGFTLIQGYYFCRPVLMENRTVPANRLSHVEILRLLQSDAIDMHQLARQVKRDASLTYRLVRLINSPMCAMRQEVRSVQAALIAVGEETFRRLATLAIASELNAGQPEEVLRTAFVRARFCELAAEFCGLDWKEQYLLGLLSLLPAMLHVPMKELAPSLPMREEILRALMGEKLPERCLLCWLEGHERGDWAACDMIAERRHMNVDDLLGCYREALAWAESALRFA
jgi:EAL and modified HD-GYP domain-containing signal transduction protein